MNLFQTGNFTLNSGAASPWKIECDAFSDSDWLTLAEIVLVIQPWFSEVHGVPTGGLKLAKLLKRYCKSSGPILIVDDVLTTGNSMNRLRNKLKMLKQETVGVVVFARGACPDWVQPIFQINSRLI